ncbi:hypothetical protein PanWU01x14_134560 [Parasponia andersonii]|uniref:Uncharacterized protein n=1 Tax=Parasponia andersonii TaxID=3476 RepID=A0A2P5CPN1_PARAD|nr:hypothetical protein PanWU01x14_134560 [Parasponia andersonii]
MGFHDSRHWYNKWGGAFGGWDYGALGCFDCGSKNNLVQYFGKAFAQEAIVPFL